MGPIACAKSEAAGHMNYIGGYWLHSSDGSATVQGKYAPDVATKNQ